MKLQMKVGQESRNPPLLLTFLWCLYLLWGQKSQEDPETWQHSTVQQLTDANNGITGIPGSPMRPFSPCGPGGPYIKGNELEELFKAKYHILTTGPWTPICPCVPFRPFLPGIPGGPYKSTHKSHICSFLGTSDLQSIYALCTRNSRFTNISLYV